MLYSGPPTPLVTLQMIQEAHGVNFTRRVRQLAPCDWQLHALASRRPAARAAKGKALSETP